MQLLTKYANTGFASYEDFYENFQLNIPEGFNFGFDIVDEYARLEPEKKCLLWCNDKGEEKSFTFAQMSEASNRAANVFAKYGIKKGDYVMLVLKRHFEFWPAIIALHKIGAVAIPTTNLLTVKDLVYRFQMADVSAIVASGECEIPEHADEAQKQYDGLKTKIICRGSREGGIDFTAETEAASGVFARPQGEAATQNGDTMLLYFTSGTTGYPKMVTHDFAYPLAHAITANFWQCVREDKLHLTVSETGWAKSVWGKLYGQWICGATVFVYDYAAGFQPAHLLEKIEEYKIATFCAPPTIYRFFIKEDLTKYDLSSLEYCAIAGEPLNPEIYYQFLKATGHKLHEGFGQTEVVVAMANFPWIEPRPGSMGKPSPSYRVHLVKEGEGGAWEDCETGETGQIVFDMTKGKPYGLFKGYYKDDAKNAEAMHDGYYFTGDLAWQDEDGYYWYVGRADDVIKSSGYRIGPFEVESALLEHPSVLECAITAVPDEIRGQVVKATVVLARGYAASDELKKELQNHVKKTTAPYKYPRIVEFVEELPKTISGKIRRVEIRENDKK